MRHTTDRRPLRLSALLVSLSLMLALPLLTTAASGETDIDGLLDHRDEDPFDPSSCTDLDGIVDATEPDPCAGSVIGVEITEWVGGDARFVGGWEVQILDAHTDELLRQFTSTDVRITTVDVPYVPRHPDSAVQYLVCIDVPDGWQLEFGLVVGPATNCVPAVSAPGGTVVVRMLAIRTAGLDASASSDPDAVAA